MGFFSEDCVDCGHPLLSLAATSPVNRWMNNGVAIGPQGNIHAGSYDGYGALDGADAVGLDATVWHYACWTVAGRPLDYRGPSASSADQGWFFGNTEHALPEPGPPRCEPRIDDR